MDRRTRTAFAGASVLLDCSARYQLRLAWRLLWDEHVPALKFAVPVLLALYLVSPIDLIPDFLLGFGQVDDLGVVFAGVLLVARVIPRLAPGHVVDEHVRDMRSSRPESKRDVRDGKIFETRFDVRG